MKFYEGEEYPELRQVHVRVTVDDRLVMEDDPHAYDDEGAALQSFMMFAEDGMRRARAKQQARYAMAEADEGREQLSNEAAPDDKGVAMVLLFPEDLT